MTSCWITLALSQATILRKVKEVAQLHNLYSPYNHCNKVYLQYKNKMWPCLHCCRYIATPSLLEFSIKEPYSLFTNSANKQISHDCWNGQQLVNDVNTKSMWSTTLAPWSLHDEKPQNYWDVMKINFTTKRKEFLDISLFST